MKEKILKEVLQNLDSNDEILEYSITDLNKNYKSGLIKIIGKTKKGLNFEGNCMLSLDQKIDFS